MPTIGAMVAQNAQRVPETEAVVAGDVRWTWRELEERVAVAAGVLRSLGLRHGDRLGVIAANTPGHVVAYLAALRLGAIVAPVNTRLAPPELAYVLDNAGVQVVAIDPVHRTVLEAALALATVTPTVVVTGGDAADDLLAADAVPVPVDAAQESDPAFIVHTSGTTGRPKGAVHSHHSAIWAAMAQIVSLGMRDGERYLHLPPLYHSGGVVYLNAMVLLGGTNVLVDGFEPGTVLETIETEQITSLLGVPTMLQLLTAHPDAAVRETSSWRVAAFGAAPMPASAIERLLEMFPTVAFYQQCGQTEAGPTGLYSTTEQVRATPDSSGHQAQPFITARVVDETGAEVGPDQVGELCFAGEPIMVGYWNDPEATANAIRDGWLHTGDLVHVRPDGSMKLVDRIKDVIITGGRNVYSAEVEQVLADMPGVADVAVVGRPDEVWGETIVAVLTPVDGAEITLEDLRVHCAGRIADYKIPRELVLGAVPRNAAGKVQKAQLRQRF
jgi:fatty-acyl-CoA synthase